MTTTQPESKRAVVMREYGRPDVLRIESLPIPDLRPSEILIRTTAAAINRSDLEVRSGNWPIRRQEPFPYVPGLEVIGDVAAIGESVDQVRAGEQVFTVMQGLGGVRALRDGGYADHVIVDADVVAPVPDGINPFEAAALGLGAITADQGLALLGDITGRRIAVTGAIGGVGSNAVSLVAAQGGEVVAIARRGDDEGYLRSLGAAAVVSDAGRIRTRSLDGVLDVIGAPVFEPLVAALKDGGRYSVVGALGGDGVSFSLWEVMRGITLSGYSSETLDGASLRAAAGRIFPLLRAGRLKAPAYQCFPLEQAAEAHALIEAGGVKGRLLLVPGAGLS